MATTTPPVISEDHICGYDLTDVGFEEAIAAWLRGDGYTTPHLRGVVSVDMDEGAVPSGSVVHLNIDDLGIDGPFEVTGAEPDQYRQGVVHLGVKSANLS